MKRHKFTCIAILAIAILFVCYVYAYNLPKWFPFNTEGALKEWQEKVFRNRVLYVIELQREGGYLLAQSKQACSGLLYKIKFNPRKFPMMSWRWKVAQFPKKDIGIGKKGGWLEQDDYAARVYVIFSGWNFLRIQSIEYIWDENLAEGTIMTSPYFKNLKLIVAESGKKNMNQWVFEERNIYEDYKKAFGRVVSRRVSAIALMTDSDNTVSSAEAFYKDIKVGYKDE